MKSIILKSVGIAAIVAIAGSAAHAGKMKRIKKQDQFLEIVGGKRMIGSGGYVEIKADGTANGKFEKGDWKSTWEWKGKFYCREGVFAGNAVPYNCQKVEFDGETLVITRDKGKGRVSKWTLE